MLKNNEILTKSDLIHQRERLSLKKRKNEDITSIKKNGRVLKNGSRADHPEGVRHLPEVGAHRLSNRFGSVTVKS